MLQLFEQKMQTENSITMSLLPFVQIIDIISSVVSPSALCMQVTLGQYLLNHCLNSRERCLTDSSCSCLYVKTLEVLSANSNTLYIYTLRGVTMHVLQ